VNQARQGEVGVDKGVLEKHKVFKFHKSQWNPEPPSPSIRRTILGSTTVYSVICNSTYKRPLALRCIDGKNPLGSQSLARKKALKEVLHMSHLRHPHIVVYIASFESYSSMSRSGRRLVKGEWRTITHEKINQHYLSIAVQPPRIYGLDYRRR
jgi:hypothetical protein